MENAEYISTVSGRYDMTPDGEPIIDELFHLGLGDVYVCAGLIENTEVIPDESEVMPNSGSSAPPDEKIKVREYTRKTNPENFVERMRYSSRFVKMFSRIPEEDISNNFNILLRL